MLYQKRYKSELSSPNAKSENAKKFHFFNYQVKNIFSSCGKTLELVSKQSEQNLIIASERYGIQTANLNNFCFLFTLSDIVFYKAPLSNFSFAFIKFGVIVFRPSFYSMNEQNEQAVQSNNSVKTVKVSYQFDINQS